MADNANEAYVQFNSDSQTAVENNQSTFKARTLLQAQDCLQQQPRAHRGLAVMRFLFCFDCLHGMLSLRLLLCVKLVFERSGETAGAMTESCVADLVSGGVDTLGSVEARCGVGRPFSLRHVICLAYRQIWARWTLYSIPRRCCCSSNVSGCHWHASAFPLTPGSVQHVHGEDPPRQYCSILL